MSDPFAMKALAAIVIMGAAVALLMWHRSNRDEE